jgi:hypothetical protein
LSRDRVGVPDGGAQTRSDLPEHGVTGRVPVSVVDRLEIIEVEEEHRDGQVVSPRSRHRQLEVLFEHRPVGKAGERVVVGHVLHPQLRLLARRDVEHDPWMNSGVPSASRIVA